MRARRPARLALLAVFLALLAPARWRGGSFAEGRDGSGPRFDFRSSVVYDSASRGGGKLFETLQLQGEASYEGKLVVVEEGGQPPAGLGGGAEPRVRAMSRAGPPDMDAAFDDIELPDTTRERDVQGEPRSGMRSWVLSLRNAFTGERIVKKNVEALQEGLEGKEKTPYIVMFKNSSTIEELRGICMQYGVYFKSNQNCNMPNVCRRIYSSGIKGLAGYFTQRQLDKLIDCFEDEVDYVEKDEVVQKTEGPPSRRGMGESPRVENFGDFDVNLKSGGEEQVSKQMREIGEAFEKELENGGDGGLATGFRSDRVQAFGGMRTQNLNVALWNLDRIDQRDVGLDKKYQFSGARRDDGTGNGVTVYVVDSGLLRTHQEFARWDGRGSRASHGWDFVDDDPDAGDCDGHGTHVAATAVGRTAGVAKSSQVVGVRVLDCSGSGSVSDVVAGLDWVAKNHAAPAIVTMSLGIGLGHWSRALEDAVKNLVNEYGITVVVASGNSGVDSCYVAPGNTAESITVAASDLGTKFGRPSSRDQESLYRWSNTGSCVDIFAPGVDIYSACGGPSRCSAVTDSAYAWASGTSMAVPLVAGVAATYLAEYPTAAPSEVKQAILRGATTGTLQSPYMKPGSPNRVLYSKILQQDTFGQAQRARTRG